MKKESQERVPNESKSVYEEIVKLTDEFCKRHLDEEYAELARKLAAALARKRPSPLMSGGTMSWACGILYALGKVNFLFDKTQTPHMRADELCEECGIASSTGSAKAKKILDMFRMYQLDPKWTMPSKIKDNPMAWLIQVNGLIVDARSLPRDVQEEAFRLGLIPFVP
ncbi:MAG: DUF6398 domain-containing protein [Terriglobia bacterium]